PQVGNNPWRDISQNRRVLNEITDFSDLTYVFTLQNERGIPVGDECPLIVYHVGISSVTHAQLIDPIPHKFQIDFGHEDPLEFSQNIFYRDTYGNQGFTRGIVNIDRAEITAAVRCLSSDIT